MYNRDHVTTSRIKLKFLINKLKVAPNGYQFVRGSTYVYAKLHRLSEKRKIKSCSEIRTQRKELISTYLVIFTAMIKHSSKF